MLNINTLTLLRFVVLATGLTYYLTQSVIFSPVRGLARKLFGPLAVYFVYCPSCVGTWMGLVLYLLGFWPWLGWQEALLAMVTSCVCNRLMPQDDMRHELHWGDHDETKEG